ncbi:salutaridinol 7-O-acetyltransferase, putative [Ricinus communis]|uniref:Salutaridinol 7-O-acetyltransferase, putative n=1 Tax=Ricinus communis TaxID=3988 RepID=B9R8L6_RICCO|nr:salutaridinol 7-O-acetyltransferase, putative [Ricinus communis]
MEVEIKSKGCVRPSSPTPHHLKTYRISLLDQFLSYSDVPVILYYPNQNPDLANDIVTSQRSLLLKQSLSETLSLFYPLAGKFKDVFLLNARANIDLCDYLNKPDLAVMNKLLPREVSWYRPIPGSYTASIQENTFACGGIAIGVLISHKIMDGAALASFLKDWAATASKSRKLATTRFVLDTSAIASLEADAVRSGMENPARVEVVSALLSKCIMAVLIARSRTNDKPIAFTHMVNLRRRVTPPFPEISIGNFLWLAPALCKTKLTELTSFARQIREAIWNIDKGF